MFTGIVDHCGQIQNIQKNPKKIQMTIETIFTELEAGESIAIDGVCLTVIAIKGNQFVVELSPETMQLTIASKYKVGQKVNLERALRLMDRIGGHFVTGHVDGLSTVTNLISHEEFTEIEFGNIPLNNQQFLAKKGSITVNGVSLTLNQVTAATFTVMLIPHTLQRTNLSALELGSKVNVEFDYLAKIVHSQLINRETV